MIPAFLLTPLVARLGPFFGRAAGWGIVALAVLAVAGFAYWRFWAWVGAREAAARVAVIAELQVATAAEHERRQAVLEEAQAAAQQSAAALASMERTNASILSRIAELSRVHDGDHCLGADSVRRLRQLGRGQARPKTGQ